jgi:hypothetical protein
MHTRVPITLRIVHPHAPPAPTVASVDLFAVLQPHDPITAARSLTDEYLTLDMARVLATGFDHDDVRTLQAYLADAARRWADTGQV